MSFSDRLNELNKIRADRDWDRFTDHAFAPLHEQLDRDLDPPNKDLHEPGAKADTGKLRPSLLFHGFPRALSAVTDVATYGAAKYTPGGWRSVPYGEERYADAQFRHELTLAAGEINDKESGLPHLAHVAWNALARLELYLQRREGTDV